MQAAGGLISVTGEPGRPGVRVGTSTIDQGTGTWAAIGVLAALLERERTGEGSVVDVSLYETAIGYLGYHLVGYLADGTVPRGQGTRFPMVAPYEVLPDTRRRADGRPAATTGSSRRSAPCWTCRTSSTTRASGRTRIASGTATRSLQLLAGASRDGRARRPGTSASPRPAFRLRRSRTSRDVLRSPQTEALGILQRLDHSRIDGLTLPALPLSFDGERALHPSPPPRRRRALAEILREAGYSDEEIAALRRRRRA